MYVVASWRSHAVDVKIYENMCVIMWVWVFCVVSINMYLYFDN